MCLLDFSGTPDLVRLEDALRRAVREAGTSLGEAPAPAVIDFRSAPDPVASAEAWLAARRGVRPGTAGQPGFDFTLLELGSERGVLCFEYQANALDPIGADLLARRCAELYGGEETPHHGADTGRLVTVITVLAVYLARMRALDEVVIGVTLPVPARPSPAEVDRSSVRVRVPDGVTWAQLEESVREQLTASSTQPIEGGPAVTALPGPSTVHFGVCAATITHLFPAPADLALYCRADSGDGRTVSLEVPAGEAADDHRGRLAALLTAATTEPDRPVHDTGLLTARDRARVLGDWNDTAVPLPDLTVPELFDKRAAETPDAIAVEADAESLSYSELSLRSASLARRLADRGVRVGDSVGVLMGRSAHLVVTMLAVARAGAVYVPLDRRYPPARMRSILSGVRAALLVVDETTRDHEIARDHDVLLGCDTAGEPSQFTDLTPGPGASLQIIHTSGSTGDSKGVEVTHRNVVALALDRVWLGGTGHRMLFHSPHAWDAGILEVLVPLLTGGRVVVLSEDLNAVALRKLAGTGRITMLWLTAGLFNALAEGDPECLTGAREVWTGGDVVSPRAARRIAAACPGITVYNGYGPVETTVFATRHRVTPGADEDSVPIGTPMDNTRVYVLDDRLRPLPPGADGQVYVAGEGVARGYAGRPDLTEERFLPDPYGDSGERMYATGDRARWRADGSLVFLGRADGQVKINGFRVEPGEIEAVLATHPDVAQAAVVVRKTDDGSGRILAWAVAGPGTDGARLREHLAERLPTYLVPAEVLLVSEIPLTANGKVDRARLAGRPERLPLSRAQEAATASGHVTAAVRLSGPVDEDVLRAALADVVCRHESLRTIFVEAEGKTFQRVLPGPDAVVELEVPRAGDAQLPRVLAEVCRREFAAEGLPLRAALVTVAEDEHVLVLVLHPLAGDPASLDIVGGDLGTAYAARREGRPPTWAPLTRQYRDFLLRQRNSPDPGRRAAFPESTSDGLTGALPTDHPRPASPTHRAGEAGFHLGRDLQHDLAALAERTGTTLPTVLHTGLAALLTFRGAGTDLRVGAPVSGRPTGFDAVTGRFEHTVVLRHDTSGDPSFLDFLERVRQSCPEAVAHPGVPFAGLAERFDPAPVPVQVMLAAGPEAAPLVAPAGTTARPHPAGSGRTPHDLAFFCHGGEGAVVFDRDLFDYETAWSLAEEFVRLLRAAAARPELRLSRLRESLVDTGARRGDVARILADMWSDLLDVPVEGEDASFWQLGGHSLLGVTLVARVRERFGVRLKLRDLFQHPNLGDLVKLVEAATVGTGDTGDTGDTREMAAVAEVPASGFQRQIWLAEKLQPERGLYNVPFAWRLSAPLDNRRLGEAMARVIERNEALRTAFAERGGELRQVVGEPWRPVVREDRCDTEEALAAWLRAEADESFDLGAGRLLRTGLVDTPDGQILTITVHHIVFDITSVRLLLGELDRAYTDSTDPASPPQYRELVAATEPADPDALARRVNRLRGAPARLATAAPERPEPHGILELELPADLLPRMLPLQAKGMSWFMVAVAALAGALHRWTGHEDVTVGFPADTRSGHEFAGVLGPCLNTIAVRSACRAGTSLGELLGTVRDEVLGALDDQHVPFDAIVEALNPPRTAGSTPYLDVVLAPQVQAQGGMSVGDAELTGVDLVRGTTGSVGKFAVSVSLTVSDEEMTGVLLYRGDRLSAHAARELAGVFGETLEAILDDPDRPVGLGELVGGHGDPGTGKGDPGRRDDEPGRGDGEVERRVAAIWSSVLDLGEVGLHENFFDLGGNSLKLVTLHGLLCREFGVELPIQRLFENSTVHALARYLGAPGEGEQPPAGALPDRRARRRETARRRAGGR